MSQIEKLIKRILSLSKDIRFDELVKVLELLGYKMTQPRSGSSHYIFRKPNSNPISLPKNNPIKSVYVKEVIKIIEEEIKWN